MKPKFASYYEVNWKKSQRLEPYILFKRKLWNILKYFFGGLKKSTSVVDFVSKSVYVANKCIRKSGKLTPDLLDVTEKFEN